MARGIACSCFLPLLYLTLLLYPQTVPSLRWKSWTQESRNKKFTVEPSFPFNFLNHWWCAFCFLAVVLTELYVWKDFLNNTKIFLQWQWIFYLRKTIKSSIWTHSAEFIVLLLILANNRNNLLFIQRKKKRKINDTPINDGINNKTAVLLWILSIIDSEFIL